MTQYLVSVFEPAGDPPPAEDLERIFAGIAAIHRDLEAAGAWVFAGGLHPPSTATGNVAERRFLTARRDARSA